MHSFVLRRDDEIYRHSAALSVSPLCSPPLQSLTAKTVSEQGFTPVSAWGKEAGLELEEVKTLLRHENLATTSEVYGDLGMEAKRRIQQQLVNFVKQQATRVQ